MHITGDLHHCGAAMPILTVRHVTTYHYKQPVAFGEHHMMLRPRDDLDGPILGSAAGWSIPLRASSAVRSHGRAAPALTIDQRVAEAVTPSPPGFFMCPNPLPTVNRKMQRSE